jgi:hypothetical protein
MVKISTQDYVALMRELGYLTGQLQGIEFITNEVETAGHLREAMQVLDGIVNLIEMETYYEL